MIGPKNDRTAYTPEINVTPLVDVVLVLLIIFMLIVPSLTRGYDVDVPEEAVATSTAEERLDQVVLRLDRSTCAIVEPPGPAGLPPGCVVRLGAESVLVADLASRVQTVFADRAPRERLLFLAADEQLNYEGVLRVVDVAQSGVAGLRIGFVREE